MQCNVLFVYVCGICGVCQDPPTLDETRKAIQGMRNNRAAGVDHVITSEALQSGGEVMLEVIHKFCVEVFTSLTPPRRSSGQQTSLSPCQRKEISAV